MINTENRLDYIHQYGIDTQNREVYLHSYIDTGDNESGVDYRVAINLEKNIRYLNSISSEPIFIHMHLPGGVWGDCMGMYDSIRASKSSTIILAYGSVESASSIILQAANLRILMPNTNVLIHYGSISVDNEHKAALSWVQWSEKETKKMLDIFTEKCLCSQLAQDKSWKKYNVRKYISSQLSQRSDWFLDADEAVYNGFADGIFGQGHYNSIENIKNKFNKTKTSSKIKRK